VRSSRAPEHILLAGPSIEVRSATESQSLGREGLEVFRVKVGSRNDLQPQIRVPRVNHTLKAHQNFGDIFCKFLDGLCRVESELCSGTIRLNCPLGYAEKRLLRTRQQIKGGPESTGRNINDKELWVSADKILSHSTGPHCIHVCLMM